MSFYSNLVCGTCEKSSACSTPCPEYSDASYLHHMEKESNNIQNSLKMLKFQEKSLCTEMHNPPVPRVVGFGTSDETGVLLGFRELDKEMENVSKNNDLDEFMYNFIESSVDQAEFLQVCNESIHPREIVDWGTLLEYMQEKNRLYAEENGLCDVCHSELIRENQVEEYWGSKMVVAVNWVCPHNC